MIPAKTTKGYGMGEGRRGAELHLSAEEDGEEALRRRFRDRFHIRVSAFVPRRYVVLGTDGFGRSDTRERLRRFFEVDRDCITLAALTVLAEEGTVARVVLSEALEKYGIDPEKPDPAVR